LYAHSLEQEIAVKSFPIGAKLMHFSPEATLGVSIKQKQLFDYATDHVVVEDAEHHVDLMNLPFADASIDFLMCSHVLEHAPNDRQAIREPYKKGIRGILMAPLIPGLACTDEETTQALPKERWRRIGQDDHVRLYAHDDYMQRNSESGFNLRQLDQSYFGVQTFKRLGLKDSSILYIVSKA
jgi:SAM-dependent methyltransferase